MKNLFSYYLKNLSFFVLIVILAISGCKKSSTPEPTKGVTGVTGNTGGSGIPTASVDTDVYMVGTVLRTNGKNAAAFWKNGVVTKINAADTTLHHYGVAITIDSHNNIYIAGYALTSPNPFQAEYWKTGMATSSALPDAGYGSRAFGIAVNGGDLDIAGVSYDFDHNPFAVYWKNNESPVGLTAPGNSYSLAYAVTANNQNLFFAGKNASITTGVTYRPFSWQGNPISGSVLGPDVNGTALAISVSGTNTYTAGYTATDNTETTTTAKYWVNGTPTSLGPGRANAIAVNANGDIYVAGQTVLNDGSKAAAYWKNGTAILPALTNGYNAAGIAVVGNTIYVIGDDGNKGAYWKNSIQTVFENFSPKGIVVVTHPH